MSEYTDPDGVLRRKPPFFDQEIWDALCRVGINGGEEHVEVKGFPLLVADEEWIRAEYENAGEFLDFPNRWWLNSTTGRKVGVWQLADQWGGGKHEQGPERG